MLKLAPIDVAPLEGYSVEDFRDWLTAGYKDLERPDTRARAFAPLHLLVGHGDITNELNSVYDVLSGGAQILFRRGLADAISALPTEANAVPVLKRLLHLESKRWRFFQSSRPRLAPASSVCRIATRVVSFSHSRSML